MAEESLEEQYNRLLREGRTDEATDLVSDSENVETTDSVDTEVEKQRYEAYTELDGVGEEVAEELFEEFGDWPEFVENVDKKSLVDVSGIGEARAESLIDQVEEREE